jgi:medium-chain acyl-[acyl-carrier-protein] hydrolase
MRSTPIFFVPQPREAARARLVCFPHCGGSASAFFSWGAQLGAAIECVSVQYPARGQRINEAPLTTIAELTAEIGGRWDELSDLPLAFYGHSFGALVAFELARYLRRRGLAGPTWLAVGASSPPHDEPPSPAIHALPDAAFIEAIQARYGGIPVAVAQERELLSLFMCAMRADFKAYEQYRAEPDAPLSIPITAFAGDEDPAATPERMREWEMYTETEFDLKVLSGGHFFPKPSLAILIQTIKERLLPQVDAVRIERKDAVAC